MDQKQHPVSGEGERCRLDLLMEDRTFDDTTRIMRVAMVPDPRRYETREINGEKLFWDKYLEVFLPSNILQSIAAQSSGMPMYYQSPTIADSPKYAQGRLQALRSELKTGTHSVPTEQPYPHRQLGEQGDRPITFLSVDICGATALRNMDSTAFDRAHEIMIRELGTVVGHFGGSILKVTGDGFIAFNDQRSWTNQCDNCVDMGLTFLAVLRGAVNSATKEAGLPELHIRVGAEHGEATIKEFSVPATGFTARDAVSDALNRAVKIQESCKPDEFRIGRRLYELVHVQWLERAEGLETSIASEIGVPNYRIYRVQ